MMVAMVDITTPFGTISREEVVATKYVVGTSVFETEEAAIAELRRQAFSDALLNFARWVVALQGDIPGANVKEVLPNPPQGARERPGLRRADDLGITEEQWEELRVSPDDVAVPPKAGCPPYLAPRLPPRIIPMTPSVRWAPMSRWERIIADAQDAEYLARGKP